MLEFSRLCHGIYLFRPRSRSSRSSRADDSSVTSSRNGQKPERPPSRESARSGRRSHNQSRDYTDDSYTLTESEMSFDIPETRPRRSSRDVRSGRRSVELPIKEEEEGEGTLLWWHSSSRAEASRDDMCWEIIHSRLNKQLFSSCVHTVIFCFRGDWGVW